MTQKNPSGESFLNPEQLLRHTNIMLGSKVADLGCGGGYFVMQAARMVGDHGQVYGVDVLKTALSSLLSKARIFGLTNIQSVWSNAEVYGGAKRIKDGSLDLVLLVQILFQSQKHHEIFREAGRMLKRKGQLLVVDWKKSGLHLTPHQLNYLEPEEVKQMAAASGLILTKQVDAGPYHFGLIFEKR
ncbi:MAG: methyltransferase domain-containing protein [Patescibacteria group bacterium]|jgi:ubiquinone/menaquinone biosynthesis C-methylase UbiE